MDRKKSLLSSEIQQLLIAQITHELKNHNLYKNFENYFSIVGLKDLEIYWNKRAEEEYNHHKWIFDYMSEADCKVLYEVTPLNTEQQEIKTIADPFIFTVTREIETTQMLYKIYEQALSEKDYMTASWLFEKLIKEQIEEENTSRMALTILELEEGDIFNKCKKIKSLLLTNVKKLKVY
jgi:ferritin